MTYTPTFKTQFDGGPLANKNCTPTSEAMLLDRATLGVVDVTGSEVRAVMGDTVGGTNLNEVVDSAAKYGVEVINRTRQSWTTFLQETLNRPAILQGDYDQLLLCSTTFKGDHAVYFHSHDNVNAIVGDPICHDYHTVPLTKLKAYATKLAEATGITGIYYAIGPVDSEAGMAQIDPKVDIPIGRCNISAGATIYADAAKTQVLIPSCNAATNVQIYSQRATLSAIRIDMAGGPALDLRVGWIGNDHVTLLMAGDVKHNLIVSVDGVPVFKETV